MYSSYLKLNKKLSAFVARLWFIWRSWPLGASVKNVTTKTDKHCYLWCLFEATFKVICFALSMHPSLSCNSCELRLGCEQKCRFLRVSTFFCCSQAKVRFVSFRWTVEGFGMLNVYPSDLFIYLSFLFILFSLNSWAELRTNLHFWNLRE